MDLPFPDTKCIDNALYIEHHVQRIITQQEANGVQFNQRRAARYISYLSAKQEQLYNQIRPHLSPELTVPYGVPVRQPYLRDGSYSMQVQKWYSPEDIHRVSGPFTRVAYVEPDLSKRKKLSTQLMRLGWKPRSFTPKGDPRLTVDGGPCPSLNKIDGEIGQWIADWYIYKHRQGQIEGWQKLVRDDGRIEARAITIGTPTFRFRHSGVVNVPKTSVLFGKQMRSLFHVRRGCKMVGFDASGLELRGLADAINDILFTKEVTRGDIHTKNQRAAGLLTRDQAKTFIYAFIYGAGDAKLGSIVGGGRRAGALMRRKFLASNPLLAATIEDTQAAAGRGYLIGVDGRRIHLRRDPLTGQVQVHKALNTRIQGWGAIIMKWAMVILDEWVADAGLDARKVIDMHDEAQWEVADGDVPALMMMGRMCIIEAGRMLGLNVPLDAEAKVGPNWAYTH